MGTNSLFTMKPGVSLQSTVFLPIAFPQATMALKVSSEVSGILTTSKSFITGTGLKKWSPPNLSKRRVEEAISEIGREEVFEARMVFAGALSSYSANSFCFNSMFSTTASTTRSAVWMAASTVVSMCMLERELSMNLPAASASSANCFFCHTLDALRDASVALVKNLLADVDQGDFVPGLGGHLGDSSSHKTSSNVHHLFDDSVDCGEGGKTSLGNLAHKGHSSFSLKKCYQA